MKTVVPTYTKMFLSRSELKQMHTDFPPAWGTAVVAQNFSIFDKPFAEYFDFTTNL